MWPSLRSLTLSRHGMTSATTSSPANCPWRSAGPPLGQTKVCQLDTHTHTHTHLDQTTVHQLHIPSDLLRHQPLGESLLLLSSSPSLIPFSLISSLNSQ
ncbi:hypothetical protein J4Q44_G00213890 [Coregonus suidteri]|uniref:Uncharacterized protein n=1 Tax=Coregonus suidteri TaxID=861788 RepID=A0AAN8QRF6_9TELE